jgi:hypothetical protein
MKFSSACVGFLLAPGAITAKLSAGNDANNKKNQQQQQNHLTSSPYLKVKATNTYKKIANHVEVRYEPNKLHNIEDIKASRKKNEGTVAPTPFIEDDAYGKEECVPPVTVSKTSKLDAGNLPLSSCSSSKKQICINVSSSNDDMNNSSSSIEEKKHGVCTDINNVPTAYWGTSKPIASSDNPGSYWEDTILLGSTSTVHAAATKSVLEDYLSKTSLAMDGTSTLSSDSYNTIYDTNAGEPSTVIEDDNYIHQQYYYDYHGQQEGDRDQQDDYSIHQQHDERHLVESNCETTCTGTRPDVSNFEGPFKDLINDCIDNNNCYNVAINCWNTAGINDMSYAFSGAWLGPSQSNFSDPLECWNTSAVTSMNGMFRYAALFNQPIHTWDTSQVDNMEFMFGTATSFNQPIGTWDTSQVDNMEFMFHRASSFNQPIGTWNTSQVNSTEFMFYKAYDFNQPIDTWDTSQLYSTKFMFHKAYGFNGRPLNFILQNLCFIKHLLSTSLLAHGIPLNFIVRNLCFIKHMISTNQLTCGIPLIFIKRVLCFIKHMISTNACQHGLKRPLIM